MDGKSVRMLEEEIGATLARLFRQLKGLKLPLVPNERTIHLMAKAAVAVYESAVENDQRPERAQD